MTLKPMTAADVLVTTDFEQLLQSPTWVYEEGLRFFRGGGMVNETLRNLARELEKRGIEYNVIGAVALNQHGYRRFTEDIDLLLSKEGLATFQTEMVGRGYRPAFPGASKKFRETEHNVPIEVITTGEYPGDGKPKPVIFHDPAEHYVVIDGIHTVTLERLIELKLASGMTSPGRLKDLADVQELIRVRELSENVAEDLNPFVREKYRELWAGVNGMETETE